MQCFLLILYVFCVLCFKLRLLSYFKPLICVLAIFINSIYRQLLMSNPAYVCYMQIKASYLIACLLILKCFGVCLTAYGPSCLKYKSSSYR